MRRRNQKAKINVRNNEKENKNLLTHHWQRNILWREDTGTFSRKTENRVPFLPSCEYIVQKFHPQEPRFIVIE
jgi:hypothetical protein